MLYNILLPIYGTILRLTSYFDIQAETFQWIYIFQLFAKHFDCSNDKHFISY